MKGKEQREQEKELFYDSRYKHKVLDGRRDKNRSSEKQHWQKAVKDYLDESED